MRHIVQEELKRGTDNEGETAPRRGGAAKTPDVRAGATNLSRLAHTIMCSHSCDTVLVRALRVCVALERVRESERE